MVSDSDRRYFGDPLRGESRLIRARFKRASVILPVHCAGFPEQDARQVAQRLVDTHYKVAMNKEAAGAAALFTEDAIQITPQGFNSGGAAIEKFEAAGFKDYTSDPGKIDHVTTIGNGVILVAGSWSGTYHGPDGPLHLAGYWSWTDVRNGNLWKIRQETFNVTPPPPEAKK
jgi:hypothetical protein